MSAVAFDTETRGLGWWDPAEAAFLGQWARADGEWHAPFSEPEPYIQALREADTIVAHNLGFDVHQTREWAGYDIMQSGADLHDTDLMSRLLFPGGQRKDRGGHGLKELAGIYVEEDADRFEKAVAEAGKQIGLRTMKKPGAYYDVWRAFPHILEEYGRMDARYTYDLFENFLPRFERPSQLWDLYELERGVQRILIEAERVGVAVDPEAVERLHRHYRELERAPRDELDRELGFVPKGEGSREALVEGLLKLGVPLTETTDNGQLSVGRGALVKFERDYPIVHTLFEWRRINRFLSTYIEPMRGRDVVHPSFQQAEAWTGRMSCRRPNMQNLPIRRDTDPDENMRLRSMFIPRPGYSFLVADFAGIEDRFCAHYCGVQSSRDLITQGRDAHGYTASIVYGGDESDYSKVHPQRLRCKHVRYAIEFGAGGPKVSSMLNEMKEQHEDEVTLAEARRIIHRVKDAMPGYRNLQSRIREKVQRVGYLESIMGRKLPIQPDKHYVGVAALFQGSAADVLKQAAVNVEPLLRARGGRQLMFVHDELLAEVPTEEAEAALPEVVEAMESALQLDPALKVDASITDKSYAHAK